MSTAAVSASTSADRVGNGLAVLANKCAARTFDISSGMVYASMRDQIVRAQLLVRDLKQADPRCNRLLIVGAGLAGASAAVHASAIGIETLVLEAREDAFSLQSQGSTRMVGPFMYEWPSIECQSQHYPAVGPTLGGPMPEAPNWTSKDPMPARELANKLREWLKAQRGHSAPPQFHFKVPADWTRKYVTEFVAAAGTSGAFCPPPLQLPVPITGGPRIVSTIGNSSFLPDYVILAVGMGEERVHLVDGQPGGMCGLRFWDNDDLRSSGVERMEVAVFGAGDGALQDVLRVLTKHDHPLSFIEALETGPNAIRAAIDQVRPLLASLEQQSRLFATWSSGPVYDLIDEQCERLCNELAGQPEVPKKVLSELRTGNGRVHHIYREQHLTRAYLLNRFCVHLINACQSIDDSGPQMRYVRHKDTTVVSATPASTPAVAGAGGMIQLSDNTVINPAKLVVRFGPDTQWIENFQMVRLTPETHPDRISMAAIPLPYVVSA